MRRPSRTKGRPSSTGMGPEKCIPLIEHEWQWELPYKWKKYTVEKKITFTNAGCPSLCQVDHGDNLWKCTYVGLAQYAMTCWGTPKSFEQQLNWRERIHAYTTRVKYSRRIWIYIYIYIHNYICMSIQSIFPPNNPPNVTPLSRTPSPGETLKREPTPFSESLDPVWGLTPVVHRVPWLGAWCFRLQRRTGRERLGVLGWGGGQRCCGNEKERMRLGAKWEMAKWLE